MEQKINDLERKLNSLYKDHEIMKAKLRKAINLVIIIFILLIVLAFCNITYFMGHSSFDLRVN